MLCKTKKKNTFVTEISAGYKNGWNEAPAD